MSDRFSSAAETLPTALTVKRVVHESGLSKSSIYRAINSGDLVAVKKLGKTVVPRTSFIDWMNSFEPLQPQNTEAA